MKAKPLTAPQHLEGTPKPGWLDATARRLVLAKLAQLEHGALTVLDDGEVFRFGEAETHASLKATITLHDRSFYGDIAFAGSIGAGEAFMRHAWDCDDLVALVRILLRNRHVLDGMEQGTARLTKPLQKLFHWVNRNTRRGARRNISAHYDLGNDFFKLWLDESMMYSSAVFANADMSLAEAQTHRLDMVCRKLDLQAGDHVIEIGTGWGGFAMHAARHYGCRVTSTTISDAQYQMALERVQAAGLSDHIELLQHDYRDLSGQYDKLVSIEMIEAIGSAQYDTYFARCAALLRPGGKMLIQAITIADQQYDYAQRNVDFIQRYIFPGGSLPSLSVMVRSIARASDLLVTGVEDIGLHYATTLRHWRHNFNACLSEVRALGCPERFIRMWMFYLCYSEGGFLERAISDVHLLAEKPAGPNAA